MQLNFSDLWRPISAALVIAAFTVMVPDGLRGATITYYTTRASFNAAEPGLPLEDFDPLFAAAVISGPLSSTSNNSAFSAGNILPGITISNKNGGAMGLYAAGGAVAPNYFEDPLVLSFAPGIAALGLDIFASNGGTVLGGSFTADIFSGATRLDSKNLTEPAATFFFGLSSTASITSVILTYNQTEFDGTPFVDNIAFGSTPASAPEPSSAGLAVLGMCCLIAFRLVRWR